MLNQAIDQAKADSFHGQDIPLAPGPMGGALPRQGGHGLGTLRRSGAQPDLWGARRQEARAHASGVSRSGEGSPGTLSSFI